MSETESDQTPSPILDELGPETEEEAQEEEAGSPPGTEPQEGEPEQTIPEAEPEQPEASAPAGAVGEKELERMFKRVETANAAYARKVGEILGDEAGVLETCPRCAAPFLGLIWPPLMKPVSAEVKAAVLTSVGEEPPQVSEPDSYSRRCDACGGWGRVLSGSKLNTEKTLRCIPCQGRGWVAVGDERRVPQQAVTEPVSANGPQAVVEQPPNADPWGRTPGDPDYGRLPQYVGQA